MDVVFLPAALDACALYRMFIPHMHIPGARYVHRHGRAMQEDFAGADVAVVQRLASAGNMEAILMIKDCGSKIVYDLDDNVWALPAYNPAKAAYSAFQTGFESCAASCDVITVSTKGLKLAVEHALPRIKADIIVVPNGVDFDMFHEPAVNKEDGKVIVGWAGSNTHQGDVAEVWELLGDVIKANKQAVFEMTASGKTPVRQMRMVGGMQVVVNSIVDDPNGIPKALENSKQLRLRHWVPVAEFMSQFSSWGWDIALAPLEDNKFNRSKSNIKMLEAAAVGAVCLVSPVQPYHEFCCLDEELKWLMCYTRSQWQKKLTELINEPERRQYLAYRMLSVAKTFYNAKIIAGNWQHTFQRAVAHAS